MHCLKLACRRRLFLYAFKVIVWSLPSVLDQRGGLIERKLVSSFAVKMVETIFENFTRLCKIVLVLCTSFSLRNFSLNDCNVPLTEFNNKLPSLSSKFCRYISHTSKRSWYILSRYISASSFLRLCSSFVLLYLKLTIAVSWL